MVQVPFFFFSFLICQKGMKQQIYWDPDVSRKKQKNKTDPKISNETFFGTAEHMAQSSNVVWGEIKNLHISLVTTTTTATFKIPFPYTSITITNPKKNCNSWQCTLLLVSIDQR